MPPDDSGDKAQAAKPAATFSSFINKNTTGKKFAPKAARRRPAATTTAAAAAAAAAAPAPVPASVATAPASAVSAPAPVTVTTTAQPESEPAPAPTPEHDPEPEPEPSSVPQQQAQLPTPAATQEPRHHHAPPEEPVDEAAAAPPTPAASVQPWVAVNQQPLPTLRGRSNATAPAPTDETQGTAAPSITTAKTRGKRKAAASDGVEHTVAPPPAKRNRRLRRDTEQDNEVAVADPGDDGQDAAAQEPAARRKPRKPRQPRNIRSAASGTTAGQEGEQLSAPPRRKGRPPREPTPEDAEDHVLDPNTTFMDHLASRNIRVGKLSNREREMRKIDWVAVRQRWREEDLRHVPTKQTRDEEERRAAEQMQSTDLNPRYRLVNGNIELVPESITLDREANADREIETYETVEEQDLTTRITTRSFMKNNKRFPNEFLLPGQGKRWTTDETNLFYQGLRSFGTDFQMISRMFPGSTRRSIKTKFTREEREHPDDVREALLGKSEMTQHWGTFLAASKMEEESLADADEIKRQLAEEEAEWRERIAAATAETLERKRQQREAGLLDDEAEGNEASNKENGKGKRRKRDREKQVTFEQEDGVEILGGIDDDDTWGKE